MVDGSTEPKLALAVAVAGLALALGLQFGRILVLGAAHRGLASRDLREIDPSVGECEQSGVLGLMRIGGVDPTAPGVGAAHRGGTAIEDVTDEGPVVAERAGNRGFSHLSHTPSYAAAEWRQS